MEYKAEENIFTLKSLVYLLLMAILVYAGIVLYSDYQSIYVSLSRVSADLIFILLMLTITNYMIRYVKWRMGTKDIQGLRLRDDILVYFSGFLFSLTPSKVGETARGVLLNQVNEETEVSMGVSLTLVDRISDLIGMSILSLLALLIAQNSQFLIPSFLLLLVLLLLVGIMLNKRMVELVGRVLSNINEKLGKFPQKIYIDLSTYGKLKFLMVVCLSIISWMFEGIGLYLIFIHLEIEIGVVLSIFIFAFGTIVGAVTFLPGGLGSAEISMIGLIRLFGDTSRILSSTATIIIRFATLWFGVFFGLINYLILIYLHRDQKSREIVTVSETTEK